MENEKTSLNIRKLKKQVKGITLIALVVTIIVLLILAGIALNLTIGQNGIFSRAQKSVNTWKNAESNEQLAMGELEDLMDGYLNGNGGDDQDDEVIVDTVKIPKGFYYVGGAKNTGLIISDNPTDENKYSSSNWPDQANIPSGLEAKTGTNNVQIEDTYNFTTYCGYYDGAYYEGYFANCSEPFTSAADWESTEYYLMKTSVENNNGFYVARFEASEGTGSKAESKPGVEPWRYIAWGNSMTEIGTNGAVAKSQNMYTDKNTYAVTSTLIYGAKWDAIMNWLDPEYSTATAQNPCDPNSIVVNSDGHGNLDTGSVADCGEYDTDRLKNIYDLCGNLSEWTMEAYSSGFRVNRGGGFGTSGSELPVSYRGYNILGYDDNIVDLGFRPALYL